MAKSRRKKERKLSKATYQKYCRVYDEFLLNGGNGTQAYLKFYPNSKPSSADVSFRAILEIPRMKEYIKERQQYIKKKANIDIDEMVGMLSSLIRMDISDVFNDDGTLKPFSSMPEYVRQFIVGVNTSSYTYDNGNTSEKRKVKIASKMAAFEKLLRHMGAYDKDNRQRRAVVRPVIKFKNTRNNK